MRKARLSQLKEGTVKSKFSLVALVALAFGMSSGAHAKSQIALLSPNPIKEQVDKLVADFQAKSGTKVSITYGTGVGTRKTVASGGAFDSAPLFALFHDDIETGNVAPQSSTLDAALRPRDAVNDVER